MDDSPRVLTDRVLMRYSSLKHLVAPRVCSVAFKTLWNGWTTAARFQNRSPCAFGCCSKALDAIEHYACCPVVHRVRCRLGLSLLPRSVPSFLLLSSPSSPQLLTLGALLLYACYSAYQSISHSTFLSPDASVDLMLEFCKLATMNHPHSLKILRDALSGPFRQKRPVPP